MAKPQPLTIDDKQFQKILAQLSEEDTLAASRSAVEAAGKSAMKASVKNTPVDEGDVRDSHALSIETDRSEGAVHANIDVTDPAAWYAHEQLENRHDDGRPKFLRDAIRSRRGFFQKKIRESFSEIIRKRGLAE